MTENGTLKPDEIRFVDNFTPPLAAGNYTIQVDQTLEGSGAYSASSFFTETQEFTVSGPRFRLDPTDIYAMFPPPNSQGIFDHDLPHIILNKRVLPWERDLFGDRAKNPWMALLLLDASEILPPDPGRETSNASGAVTISVKELVDPEKPEPDTFHAYNPESVEEGELSQSCQVIDITPEVFKAVMPSREDARFLAHCRAVNLAASAESKWYSVVVGGRFPSAPATGQAGRQNMAHLVSLEGFENYLDEPGNAKFPQEIARIRLVTLASWTFTCLPEGGESFSGLMLGLVARDGKPAYEYKLPAPQPGSGATAEEMFAFRVLEAGYVPCSYQTRLGERTFAWYRGPFTPQPAPRLASHRAPFLTSTQAMIYDPEHGLFDLSYAVAWETGRLLALSDPRFGAALLNWRRKAHRLIDQLSENSGLRYGLIRARGRQSHEPRPGIITAGDAFMSDLLGRFANTIEPEIFKPSNKVPAGSSPILAEARGIGTNLVDLYQDERTRQDLLQAGGKELEFICEWLAHLYLLYGVPFTNLVPDERLLPRESIRFFYLDQNWLEVMQEGALSIGIQSSRDTCHWEALYGFIRDQVHMQVNTLVGEDLQGGLLLRSAVVSGWPGLEIRACSASDGKKGSGQVKLLRMDRRFEDVLLCLFDQVPAWVEVDEPKEGLHFGVEMIDGEEKINLRYWTGQEVGKLTNKTITPRPDELRDEQRKLNIQALLDEIKAKVDSDGENELGPAAFALQMVKTPGQMVFQRAAGRG